MKKLKNTESAQLWFQVHRQVGWADYEVSIKNVSDSLTKISDQLRGPLASLGGPPTSERGH